MEKSLGFRFVDWMTPSKKHPRVVSFTRPRDYACQACGAGIASGEATFRLHTHGGVFDVCRRCRERLAA